MWSSLSKKTKADYKRKGVTPGRYNAWQRLSPSQKSRRDRMAYLTGRESTRRLAPVPPGGTQTARATPSPVGAGQRRTLVVARAVLGLRADGARIVNRITITHNVMQMRPRELSDAETIPIPEWRDRARLKEYPGYHEFNPFHYH